MTVAVIIKATDEYADTNMLARMLTVASSHAERRYRNK